MKKLKTKSTFKIKPDAISNRIESGVMPAGKTVYQGLYDLAVSSKISPSLLAGSRVFIDGRPLPEKLWKSTIVEDGQYVTCAIPLRGGGGGGGKNPLNTILMLTVVVLASVATWGVGGVAGLSFGGAIGTLGLGSTAGAIAGMAVLAGGMMLVNAIAPASTPKLSTNSVDNEQAEKTWAISGTQNKADPYGVVPVVLGKVRFAPRFAGSSYSVIKGNDQYVRYLMCVAGDCDVEDARIGDTPLTMYSGVNWIVHKNWQGTALNHFGQAVSEEQFGVVLKHATNDYTNRTTATGTKRATILLTFPSGIKKIKKDGKAEEVSVSIAVRYRLDGSNGAWTNAGTYTYSGKTVTAQRRSIDITFPSAGRYTIGMFRTTDDALKDDTEQTVMDEVQLTAIQSWRDRPAITYQGEPLTVIELELKASEELSGNVNEFNAVFKNKCSYFNGTNTVYGYSSNPAALGQFIMSGCCSAHPAAQSELDLASWGRFYLFCETYGWRYNGVITTQDQAGEILHNVLAAGRGSYALLNGHGVVFDDPQQAVEEIVSQRNSWNFTAKTELKLRPIHALRMRFLNERLDYQEDEMLVFNDGYSEANATEIIEWEQDGVTDPDLIWKHGRLRLADLQLRQATYTFNMEAESITLARGSRLRCAHDVTFWGVGSGRVIELIYTTMEDEEYEGNPTFFSPSYIKGIVIDEEVSLDAGRQYGINVATYANPDAYFALEPVLVGGYYSRLMLASRIPAGATYSPAFGNMVAVGLTQSVGALLMVQSITPSEKLSASITCVDAAPEIYNAITGEIPPWNSHITLTTRYQKGKPPAPSIISVVSDESVILKTGNVLTSRILVNYDPGIYGKETATPPVSVILYYRSSDDDSWHTVTDTNVGAGYIFLSPVTDGETYQLRVATTSAAGVISDISPVWTEKVIGKTSPPPDITGLAAEISDPSGVVVTYDQCEVVDFDHYEIDCLLGRLVEGSTRVTIPVNRATGDFPFSVVAVDTGGRRSTTPATVTLTVYPPATPVVSASIEDNQIYVVWQDCKTSWTIDKYIITDIFTGQVVEVRSNKWAMPSRLSGNYEFTVTAVDIFGNNSTPGQGAIMVPNIGTPSPSLRVEEASSYCVLTWDNVTAPFEISYYEVSNADGTVVEQIKGLTYRFAPNGGGTLGFRVRAVDIAGNTSPWGEADFDIEAPSAPTPSISVTDEGLVVVSWNPPASMLPISAYEVVRQQGYDEYDYGEVRGTRIEERELKTGLHAFLVRAVDTAGNRSTFGEATINVKAPGKPVFSGSYALDNNSMLYWQEGAKGTFPVTRFLFGRYNRLIDEEESLGYTSAMFTTIVETKGGDYTYYVKPVDSAGNIGERGLLSLKISQPPEFKLFYNVESDFSGEKENMVLDGRGTMIGPYASVTWEENIEEIGGEDGDETVTWSDKEGYLSPYETGMVGSYTEVIDVGDILPSCRIVVTPTVETIEGNPVQTCKIETKGTQEDSWAVIAEDGLVGVSDPFRYIRVSMTWEDGGVAVSALNIQCSIKKKQDFGSVQVSANGAEGTEVMFNTEFIDVEEPIRVSMTDNSTGKVPVVIFAGENSHPTSFHLMVFDVNGQRTSGEVQWRCQGV